ncbi:MAG: hypothetical protein HC811_06795 [Flammeovirgaceae bacterium]|nr:hypothetical protein [Flammeovirgaceae bacterium]
MRFSFIIFFTVLSLTCFGQKASVQTLFSVNNDPTLTDEFIYIFNKNNQNKNQTVTSESVLDYLELYLNFKLKIAEAKRLGFDTTAKFKKEFNSYKADLKKPYQASEDELDWLVKETYERLSYEVHASHILVLCSPETKPEDTVKAFNKIVEIKNRAERGEDFAELAKQLSEDPSAKQNGGDLGYFTAMQMVYPFETGAYETIPGKLSQIVRTRFGYHIIKVIDKRPARGEVEVSHILIPASETAKGRIFNAYDQLQSGREWSEVCSEFSEDPNTKNSGGRLRPFGLRGIASLPEFEERAFSLKSPGEISDPFSSSMGWHIIRLEKIIPLPAYDEMKEGLRRKIMRDERLQITRNKELTSKLLTFGVIEVDSVKSQVMMLADSTLTMGKWKYTGSPELLDQSLIIVDGRKSSVKEFVLYISKSQSSSGLSADGYMIQLYHQYLESILDKLEDDMLMKKYPEFRFVMKEYYEGILLFEIMEEKIWNAASEDSIGQRKYFESHRESYKAGDRVEGRIFSSKEKVEMEELRRRIELGDSLTFKDCVPYGQRL